MRLRTGAFLIITNWNNLPIIFVCIFEFTKYHTIMKIYRTILLVTEDFGILKTGDVIHNWGKRGVIKAATATVAYQYSNEILWYEVENNINKVRYLTKSEIDKRKHHFNWLGKRLLNGYLYHSDSLTTS